VLPPFIIDQIRKREQEVLERERPVLQIPLPGPVDSPPESEREDDEDSDRGVLIIDFGS
jgi:hypothetical protein